MSVATEKTMAKLSIQDLNLDGQRVFMRVDFNVPLSPRMAASQTTRAYARPCRRSNMRCAKERG